MAAGSDVFAKSRLELSFALESVTEDNVFDKVKANTIDVLIADASLASCIISEYGWPALVSSSEAHLVSGEVEQYSTVGASIIVHKGREDLTTGTDLREKVVSAVSVQSLRGRLLQAQALMKKGVEIFAEASQVIFTSSVAQTVADVLSGVSDAGFVPADLEWLDGTTIADSKGRAITLNLADLRVLDAAADSGVDFLSSTIPAPLDFVLAGNHVPQEVAKALSLALLELDGLWKFSTDMADTVVHVKGNHKCGSEGGGPAISPVADPATGLPVTVPSPPNGYVPTSRNPDFGCYYALKGMQSLDAVQFVPASPLLAVASAQAEMGYSDDEGECAHRHDGLPLRAKGVACADGYLRGDDASVLSSCDAADLACPITDGSGWCACRPCTKRLDEEFSLTLITPEERSDGTPVVSNCIRMQDCGVVPEGTPMTFVLTDNWILGRIDTTPPLLTDAVVLAVSIGSDTVCYRAPGTRVGCSEAQVARPPSGGDGQTGRRALGDDRWERDGAHVSFEITPWGSGSMTVDVRLEGSSDRVAQSPTLVYIESAADVSAALIVGPVVGGVLFCIVLILAGLLYYRFRRESFRIDASELHFHPDGVALGYGYFGVVYLATYRGTPVAVKMLGRTQQPPKPKPPKLKPSTSGSVYPMQDANGSAEPSVHSVAGRASKRESESSKKEGAPGKMPMTAEEKRLLLKGLRDMKREIWLLTRLRHPNIVTIMGAVLGKTEPPMLVLEYMDAGSLYHLANNRSVVFDFDLILDILTDVAAGMSFLHHSDVLHNDLKSRNVLVDSRFRCKVADFGLSSVGLKGPVNLGTPLWMAPEVLRGTPATKPSDVYSFGIVMWEVCTRQEPYADVQDLEGLLDDIADEKLAVPRRPDIPDEVPTDLKALMRDCWDPNPDQRPTFDEIQARLQRIKYGAAAGRGSNWGGATLLRDSATGAALLPENVARALSGGQQAAGAGPSAKARGHSSGREPSTRHTLDHATVALVDVLPAAGGRGALAEETLELMDEVAGKLSLLPVTPAGGGYLVLSGLRGEDGPSQARAVASFALQASELAGVTLGIGVHAGPVDVRVMDSAADGSTLSLFGDTVVFAEALQRATTQAGSICLSATAAALAREGAGDAFKLRAGEVVTVAGKGYLEVELLARGRAAGAPSAGGASKPTERNGGMTASYSSQLHSHESRPRSDETGESPEVGLGRGDP